MIISSPQPTASASQTIADIATPKTPILVITNDNYGSPSVVFEGEGVRDILPGVEDYTPEMESQLVSDNTEVEEHWINLGILKTVDGEFYSYDGNGGCKLVSDALSTETIDWSSEPQSQDEGVRPTIWDSFFEIVNTRYDFPMDAHLGNGETDSVSSLVDEALRIVDRNIEHESGDVVATLEKWGLVLAAAQVEADIEEGSTDTYTLCVDEDGYEYIRIDSHDEGERLVIRKFGEDSSDLGYYRDDNGLTGHTPATRSLLKTAITILDQDDELDGLLERLPIDEFRRVFLAKARSAFAEAYGRSEEMQERFETDSEYRDGFLSKAYRSLRKEVA